MKEGKKAIFIILPLLFCQSAVNSNTARSHYEHEIAEMPFGARHYHPEELPGILCLSFCPHHSAMFEQPKSNAY